MARPCLPLLLCGVLCAPAALAQDTVAPYFDSTESIELLGEAAGIIDEFDQLPLASSLFERDQPEAGADLRAVLAEAMQALEIPAITRLRAHYRTVERAIEAERDNISALRERRLSAPAEDVSALTRLTPTQTMKAFAARTRGDFDLLIQTHEKNIQAYASELDALEAELAANLGAIGIELPADQLDLWLSSVIGDDIISMSVIFTSIRGVAEQLAQLTRESNENLDYARRYYGMIVGLHKLVVQMQQDFVARVDKEILPRLASYYGEADGNIGHARQLLADDGNAEVLDRNIAANELTQEAIGLYAQLVEAQRDKVKQALQLSLREEQLAINTYKTVRLSSDVSLLIRNGAETFRALSELQVPVAATFENQQLREEFRKLTEKLLQGS